MTPERRRLAWRLAAAAVLLLVAFAAREWTGAPPAAGFRFDYPEGQRFTYRLAYRAQTAVRVDRGEAARELAGSADLAADLVLRGYGRSGELMRVGLSLEQVTRHELVMLGQPVLPDDAAAAAALTGHEALLELTERGEVRSVAFDPADPPLFKNLVQVLLGETQVVVRTGEGWLENEPTQRGVAEARYTREGEALTLSKVRTRYLNLVGLGDVGERQELTSTFAIALRASGQLKKLTAHELLQGRDGAARPRSSEGFELSLELVDRRAAEPTGRQAQATQKLAPAAAVPDPGAPARILADEVDGLTEAALFENLQRYAAGGVIRGHNHFLIQATGLLLQHPELCVKMAALFKAEGATTRGRALVLDLLAAAGSPEAQAAMRDALGSKEGLADPYYDNLFGRLSLLHAPTPETVRFVADAYGAASGERRVTTAYTLGATAGALHHRGNVAEAAPALERLSADLAAAKEPKERADLLISLGNAGLTEKVGQLLPYASADDAEVRWATAKALRKTQTPEAEAALLALSADPAVKVQQEALQVLPRFTLDAAARQQLCAAVLAGKVSMRSYNELVTVLAPWAKDDPAVRAAFQFLLTQDVVDRQVHTRIQTLLGPT